MAMAQRQVSVQRREGGRGKAAGVKVCYSSLCPLKSFPENFSRRGGNLLHVFGQVALRKGQENPRGKFDP